MRVVRAVLASAVSIALVAVGCGRSNIDDYAPFVLEGGGGDGDAVGPDGGPVCNPATCPTGCCDASGQCRAGTDIAACGGGGLACEDCVKDGFDSCDSTLHTCKKVVPQCDGITCSNGCCTTFGGQNVCLSGLSSLACGAGGQQCKDCTAAGQVCDQTMRQCAAQPCNSTTCAGCCNGQTCQSGVQDGTCGKGGVTCTDCKALGEYCNGGTCSMVPPTCGPSNCPNGCCNGNTCVTGTADKQCGKGGAGCTDCTTNNQICTAQACAPPPCNANNCTGCCLNNNCYAGFANGDCGSGGANCVDCTSMNSTCDTLATPRTCTNQQSKCPAPYSMCPNNVSTPVLSVQQGVCSSIDLQDARAACAQGWGTSTCNQFWQFIQQQKPNCGKCLAPFDFPLQQLTGIYDCVSPYVSAACNHATACVGDCTTQSCTQCPNPQAQQQCVTAVQQFNGQCFGYVQQTQCIAQALFGQAAFCSPQQYFGNYGNWLQGVGQHYCGP